MITATATVTIIVEDVNDNGPEFDKSVYEANIMENTQVGLPISFHGAKTSVIVKDKDQVFNAPIITKVVCFSRLLKCLRSLYGKQCGPRSDCSYRSSLFWVHGVCFYT